MSEYTKLPGIFREFTFSTGPREIKRR